MHGLCRALLRPGRFDVEVRVFPPDLKGRKEIIEFYVGKVKTDSSKKLVFNFFITAFSVCIYQVRGGGFWLQIPDLPAILLSAEFLPLDCTSFRYSARSKKKSAEEKNGNKKNETKK